MIQGSGLPASCIMATLAAAQAHHHHHDLMALAHLGLVDEQDHGLTLRVASRRNAPELIARRLTPMFPTVTLAQGRLVAPDRAWMPPGCRTPAPAPSHSARPSGDAGLSAEADRGSSPDIPPAAARAAHVPFATGRRRTRPAAVPSLRRAGRAGAGRASASAWVARWA